MNNQSNHTSYEIHDNYNVPFIVDVNDKTVSIRCAEYDDNIQAEIVDDEPSAVYECEEVFIGKSLKCPMTIFSGGHGDSFDGNTILLQMSSAPGKYVYIFIGGRIIKFQTEHKIVIFESPVGNNDVPYPWAADEQSNIYLIIENVILLRKEGLGIKIFNCGGPYDYFYKAVRISSATQKGNKIIKLLRGKKPFGGLTHYYLDDEEYNLSYEPDPAANYDRLMNDLHNSMSVIINKKYKSWSKSDYVKFINDYGAACGFDKMQIIGTICERYTKVFNDI